MKNAATKLLVRIQKCDAAEISSQKIGWPSPISSTLFMP
jgi:hypothetical protein